MRIKIPIIIVICLFLSGNAFGWILAIKGGKIFTMGPRIIDNGVIIIENNRIIQVGDNIQIPAGAEVIDATGKTVTPGLFDSYDQIGLVEISAVPQTVDTEEKSNPVTPEVRVIDAFNTQSKLIPVTRIEGVTTVLAAPGTGNVIAGQSAILDLYGSTVDEMLVKSPAALHINFGEDPTGTWRARHKIDSRMGLVAVMRQSFIDAQEYRRKWDSYKKRVDQYNDNNKLPKNKQRKDLDEPPPPERDLGKEAILLALDRQIPVIASANRKDDIIAAIGVAEEFNLKLILLHGAEAYLVADILKNKNIPVLLGPITTQPSSMESLGAIYENAALLDKAGVLFAIIAGSSHDLRDLRFQAGIAAEYGLPVPAALKAITINPAIILGVDKDLGSIEVGKIANIAVFDGDPLQPLTKVTDVVIEGRRVPMESFQTELYRQYSK